MNSEDPVRIASPFGSDEHVQPDGPLSGEVKRGGILPDWWEMDEPLRRTRPKTLDGSDYTYVVGSGSGLVKIGHSRRPKGRVSEMQVGSPMNLWIVHTWRLDRDGAIGLERRLHAAFLWAVSKGEWFEVHANEVVCVGDLLFAGRAEEAKTLLALIREGRDLDRQINRLENAWYYAGRRERVAAERAAKLALPDVKRKRAQNVLDALGLGLWLHSDLKTQSGKRMLAIYRAEAA